jgi:hypothetical protein
MVKKIKQGFKWLLATIAFLLATVTALAVYTNVPNAVTDEDIAVFASLGLQRSQVSRAFEEEIAMIRKVQHEVFKRAPLSEEGIPDYQPREPADLMRFGQGLCFDRSRTFDKAFSYLGMPARHVYLLYRENRSLGRAIFTYRQPSHAVTEVKTSKGWMFVDSNTEWIALTRNGEPVGADDVWKRYAEFDKAPHYLSAPWWAIRGMYSRKGQFYGSGVPFPELNWADFASWVVMGE